MSIKWGSASRPTFRQDFFRLVDARVEVAGRVMPGCDRKEYEDFSAKYCRLYEEICGRLGEGDKGSWRSLILPARPWRLLMPIMLIYRALLTG